MAPAQRRRESFSVTSPAGTRDRRQALDRLIAAAHGLATTIAATEELTQRRAELLRDQRRFESYQPVTDSSRIISLAEAAQRTGRHPEVLRRWCSDGRIPAVRIGRTWGITHATLAVLLGHSRRRPRFATRTV